MFTVFVSTTRLNGSGRILLMGEYRQGGGGGVRSLRKHRAVGCLLICLLVKIKDVCVRCYHVTNVFPPERYIRLLPPLDEFLYGLRRIRDTYPFPEVCNLALGRI